MVVVARVPVCPILEASRANGVASRPGELPGRTREREVPSNGQVSDAELARRAVAGDRRAQRLLFQTLKGALHATLYHVLGSNAHMEELLQRAFLGVFRALPFYGGEEQLTLWADRIALRVAVQHLRELRSLEGDGGSSKPGPALRLVTSTDDAAAHRRAVGRLYEQLRRLEPESQIAFALFELDGRSLTEVAELTGLSLARAQGRITRARAQLRAAAPEDDELAPYLREEQAGQG
ncbi:MAG: sigma-70 family RNA polymerase sigma factor [Deltaproteobacteria bacterium]